MTFEELHLHDSIARAIEKEGYTTPTPIQEQAIPLLLKGRDLIGIAQTGTGKTAAFTLPLLQKLTLDRTGAAPNRPKALILAPTRELAAQIGQSCKTYGKYAKLKHTVIFGGVNQKPQVQALNKGVDILVATPGRLLDLLNQRHLKLTEVQTFILDEADRMLDMGFVNDIRMIEKLLPRRRQTLMFSATMSPEITRLAQDFLDDPVRIDVAPENMPIERIQQELYYVDKEKKLTLLLHLMDQGFGHVLIFTRTKAGANKVAKALNKAGHDADALHGNKSQTQRTHILKAFQQGRITLVATDIAARGIDVDDITHVINYDLPNESENYIHRIGRTARAGKAGTAISFCDEREGDYRRAIERKTGQQLTHVEHPYHSEKARLSRQKPEPQGRRSRFAGPKQKNFRPKVPRSQRADRRPSKEERNRRRSTSNGGKPSFTKKRFTKRKSHVAGRRNNFSK